jgi:hypothetical protein
MARVWGFFAVGGVFALLALLIPLLTAVTLDLRRLRRVLAAPPCRVAELPRAGPARIRGAARLGEAGVLETPFGHKRALWVRVALGQLSGGKTGPYLDKELEIELGRPFQIEDEAGDQARVELDGARVITPAIPARHRATRETLAELLAERGKGLDDYPKLGRRLHAEEVLLEPDVTVTVMGIAARDDVGSDGIYRGSAGPVVFRARAGRAGELIVTTHDAAAIERLMLGEKLTRIIFAALALVFAGVGFAVGP